MPVYHQGALAIWASPWFRLRVYARSSTKLISLLFLRLVQGRLALSMYMLVVLAIQKDPSLCPGTDVEYIRSDCCSRQPSEWQNQEWIMWAGVYRVCPARNFWTVLACEWFQLMSLLMESLFKRCNIKNLTYSSWHHQFFRGYPVASLCLISVPRTSVVS